MITEVAAANPDLIFIQQDPMPYITRQRFLSHKAALHEVEDYSVKGIQNLNTPAPLSWEECIVDLMVLDMADANEIPSNIDLKKGLLTYSYPSIQLREDQDKNEEKFVKSITDYVIADKWSPYHEVSNVIYESLMGKQRIILGDMPELLLRQILGNTLTIQEVRDIFKMVLSKIEDLGRNNTFHLDGSNLMEDEREKSLIMGKITLDLFSHIFQAPKDLYMTALLKRVATVAFSTLAFVGTPHFMPIQKYWIPPPSGINYTQATKIPERLPNETNDYLIEKQVLFDILLGTRIWADKYVFNPFPYINEDFTKLENLDELKKVFFMNMKKYEMFRDKVINQFITLKLEFESKNPDKIMGKMKEINEEKMIK
eukprot:CAMPEP_0170519632 /NCGR_PEP_ID=MMETSP0209-20121228/4972_1 /TAXON_ID=665100 ORGANISM="Litonotus pictus, Strain P1" /NCGR_SAMPLE_ID=MMETSP0209 /ASSEMBLY_ACC=CAM_ASM_000301 /LENGTH=369 /DNA_ID=CAMNT_0010805571 /DNA_START=282 /DNA_END=1391 /DNA_ORIENTATION=-